MTCLQGRPACWNKWLGGIGLLNFCVMFSCPSSGTLYSRPKTASLFPSPVGRIEADNRGGAGRAVLYSKDMVDAVQFFRVSEG